jgi:hypothetical protein
MGSPRLNFRLKTTRKLRNTETFMGSLEGGGWKSAKIGNSLATYPTSRTVLRGGARGDSQTLPDQENKTRGRRMECRQGRKNS